MKKPLTLLGMGLVVGIVMHPALATEWEKDITANSATYGGSTGTITFDDWGYVGPNNRGYNDYAPINGFGGSAQGNSLDPSGGIGQVQHVVTLGPDGLTRDMTSNIKGDYGKTSLNFPNANMDSAVNFFQWGYTTAAGSTFNNMMIDYDGDYLIRQQDMNFQFYDRFQYQQVGTTGGLPDGTYYTGLAFQPYALSDATGWCGSVLASNPGALETMAGQITFDFAFDVYAQAGPGGPWTYFNTEIVRNFRMGSYGDITVNVTTLGGGVQSYSSSAIVNNTNPTEPRDGSNPMGVVDPDFYNLVSFHGADTLSVTPQCGVVTTEWAAGQRGAGVKKFGSLINAANQASCVAAGGVWQNSAFAGFAFIMRADGIRVIEAMDYDLYGDLGNVPTVIDGVAYNLDENGVLQPIANLSAVPIPAVMWLFGSGLLGLMGVARRRKK